MAIKVRNVSQLHRGAYSHACSLSSRVGYSKGQAQVQAVHAAEHSQEVRKLMVAWWPATLMVSPDTQLGVMRQQHRWKELM